jgi:hypothetical protein
LVEVTAFAVDVFADVPLVALLEVLLLDAAGVVVAWVVVAVDAAPADVPLELVADVPDASVAVAATVFEADATGVVPLPPPKTMAPANDANDARLSAVRATRVFTPCLRRRLRRTSGASAAVPRRSCSRRMRSARSSGVISLMSCSVPSIV